MATVVNRNRNALTERKRARTSHPRRFDGTVCRKKGGEGVRTPPHESSHEITPFSLRESRVARTWTRRHRRRACARWRAAARGSPGASPRQASRARTSYRRTAAPPWALHPPPPSCAGDRLPQAAERPGGRKGRDGSEIGAERRFFFFEGRGGAERRWERRLDWTGWLPGGASCLGVLALGPSLLWELRALIWARLRIRVAAKD